ncbi:MAG: class I SAM-dependent methyltransferase [Verrucomicrobiota bacterium]
MTQENAAQYLCSHYDSSERWISYWYQIQAICRINPQSVLEAGCGSSVFSRYVRENLKLALTTFDIDSALKPDVVGDLKNIKDYFSEKSFDCVCLFQVLEHLPFEDFELVLRQLTRISRRYILLSLPFNGASFFLKIIFGTNSLSHSMGFKIPMRKRWKFDGQHYWEIGALGYPLRRIIQTLNRHCAIRRHYFCKEHPYHYFFECEIDAHSHS